MAAVFGAQDVERGPRQGVAFEVKDSHVRRDFPADPAAKDGRGNTGGATSFNRGEIASNRGGSHVGAFASRGGDEPLSRLKKKLSPKALELRQLRYHVKTT